MLNVGHAVKIDPGRAVFQRSVLNLVLLAQVLKGLDGGIESRDGQKGSQVGRVGGNDDEPEQPPRSSHESSRQVLRSLTSALQLI